MFVLTLTMIYIAALLSMHVTDQPHKVIVMKQQEKEGFADAYVMERLPYARFTQRDLDDLVFMNTKPDDECLCSGDCEER